MRTDKSTVVVLGLGYVGCVTAACLARLGHRVHGVDMDAGKIASIQAAKAPFFEPGLEDVIRETVAAGLLTVATDLEGALAEADVAMICVGTPSARNGDLSTEQLSRSLAEIGRSLPNRRQHLVIAIRSTVFPGTTEALATALLATHPDVQVVANPEFHHVADECEVVARRFKAHRAAARVKAWPSTTS